MLDKAHVLEMLRDLRNRDPSFMYFGARVHQYRLGPPLSEPDILMSEQPKTLTDVYASLFRQDTPYHYMEMPRDQRGFMYADKVLRGTEIVGVTTSRGYSYYFRQMLSLCTIDVALSKPGTEVTVVWGNPGEPQKPIRATVAPAPYKKDNRRIDVTTLPSYLK